MDVVVKRAQATMAKKRVVILQTTSIKEEVITDDSSAFHR